MTSTGTPDAAATDTRAYAALRVPAARNYLIGAALAMMADSIEHVISYWIIFEKFHSPSLAGFAVVAHWLPFLLGSVWAGALADRYDPRRIIQISMGLFMVVSLFWGILFATDTLAKWHAVILLIVHGIAGALWAPAGQVLLHEVVGSRQLQSAIRLMATSITLGVLLGPAVGGALLIIFGATNGIFINVLIYLPLTLWLINNPKELNRVRDGAKRAISGFGDMVQTFRQVSGLPIVFSMSLLAGLGAAIVGNAHQAQMPEFAQDLGYGGQGLYYSLLFGANAAGALTAGLVLEARNLLPARTRSAFILAMLWATAIFGFAMSSNYVLSLCLLVCAGFFDLSFNSMSRTLAQLNAPAEIRGRAIGLFNVGSLGGRTFSGFTVGFGGGLIGIQSSLAISAVVLLVCIVMLLMWARGQGAFAVLADR